MSCNHVQGFDHIYSVLDKLIEDSSVEREVGRTLKRQFMEARAYLRTDFRLHVKPESLVSDHCQYDALSDDNNKEFARATTHTHNIRCSRCSSMDEAFQYEKELYHSVRFLLQNFGRNTRELVGKSGSGQGDREDDA